jgi:hypothetical protein
MRVISFDEWRDRARPLLGAGVEPGVACRVIADGVDATAADPEVRNATLMDAAIRRDVHKMHAFVRFREVAAGDVDGESAYFAWFEPEHDILLRGSAFSSSAFPT